MARPRKYKTLEEQIAARSGWNRKWYEARAKRKRESLPSTPPTARKSQKRGTGRRKTVTRTVKETIYGNQAKPARYNRAHHRYISSNECGNNVERVSESEVTSEEIYKATNGPMSDSDLDPDNDGKDRSCMVSKTDISLQCPTTQERLDLLELEVDLWSPARMYRTAALGPFMWGLLRDSPQKFNAQMDAMITSGQAITRRIFSLLADCAADGPSFSEAIESLYFQVHLAMAGIQIRRRMIRDGFLDMCPQVFEWEDPADSWTSFEEYFGSDDPFRTVAESNWREIQRPIAPGGQPESLIAAGFLTREM